MYENKWFLLLNGPLGNEKPNLSHQRFGVLLPFGECNKQLASLCCVVMQIKLWAFVMHS